MGKHNFEMGLYSEHGMKIKNLPEQQKIVRRAEALFALDDQIEARYAKSASARRKAHAMDSRQSLPRRTRPSRSKRRTCRSLVEAYPPTVKKWKKGVTKWWKVGKSGKKS